MNSPLELHPTGEEHLAAVTAIYRDAVLTGTASYEIEPPSLAEMQVRWHELVSRGFPHIVAMHGRSVVGYAYAGPFRARAAYRFLVEDSVYVDTAARGGGVGRALLSKLIEICEMRAFRQMIAVIGDGTEHPASVGLHQALGFRHVGTIEASGFKHGRWLDTVLMQRPLGEGGSSLPD